MVIDFHTHIFPDKIAAASIAHLENVSGVMAATDGTLEGLLASMEKNSVDMSVILPVVTKPSQFESINRFAAEINQQYGLDEGIATDGESVFGSGIGRLLSFGGIHPDCEDYKGCLNKIKELGLKGIKLHPDYQGTFINDIKYMRIIEYASELDLIVITHAGFDVGIPEPMHCPPKFAREVIDKVQPKKFVLAHMGGMASKGDIKKWDEVEEYLVGQNVWLDTAYVLPVMGQKDFERIAKNHGVEKILFASDSPWQDQKTCKEILQKMNFSEDELQQMFAKNASNLLGIS